MKGVKWTLALALAACVGFGVQGLQAASVIDEWANVKAPPAPGLKPVTVDPKTTALLMLDFEKPLCNERNAQCQPTIPAAKKLLDAARASGTMVVFTGTITPKVAVTDLEPGVAPTATEPFVTGLLDKFLNTDLEKILKDKGIKTLVIVGGVAQGAVLSTGSTAAQKGFDIIVPVDGVWSSDNYYDQYAVWHLSHAPLLANHTTLTSIDTVKF